MFDEAYDRESAFALYLEYEDGDDSVLGELLEKICPLIRIVFKMEIGPSKAGDREVLEGEALEELYRVIEGKYPPTDHQGSFTKFLCTVATRSMMDSINRCKPQTFEFWRVCRTPYQSDHSIAIVESRIQQEQIHKLIRRDCKERVRFLGIEKEACEYIIDCLLNFNKEDASLVKRRFSFSSVRSKYLIRYCTILVKSALIERRRDERRIGTLTPIWETGGGVLRPASQVGELYFSS